MVQIIMEQGNSVFSKAQLHEHKITVLLIDDQAMIGEAVRRMLINEEDIVFHFCQDPSQALPKAQKVEPTVILQDLVMPDVDGLTLVKFFRASPATVDIPLIVLSSKEEPKVKAEAFALGANDYLVKLPDKIELIARIRHHSKGYINLLERNEAFSALKESQDMLKAELAEAADYVRSLLPQNLEGKIRTEWKFETSTSLGGDSFGYFWLDDRNFALYLLDVCGHGVGAALLSISVMEVLNSQNLTGADFLDPASVLTCLNSAFQMENHNDMYFTIWYGVYNTGQQSLTFSSGGHPAAILLTGPEPSQVELKKLNTNGFIIGGMPDMQFSKASVQLNRYNKLFVFSDGVYELTTPDGKMWQFDEFVEVLQQSSPEISDVERLYRQAIEINRSDELDDDFSMVSFEIET